MNNYFILLSLVFGSIQKKIKNKMSLFVQFLNYRYLTVEKLKTKNKIYYFVF